MLEIEKKFLVSNDKWRTNIIQQDHILQFYISPQNSIPTVRLRLKRDTGYLTIKYPSSTQHILSRPEYEYEIPKSHIEAQKPFAIGQFIEKIRYQVEDEFGQLWEIDEFSSPRCGLVLAEIELAQITDKVQLPEWIGKDVTADKQYSNQVMSYSSDETSE